MAAVLRTRERSMLPRIKPGNGSARLMGGGAHGDTCTHQTQARALQRGLAAPTPAVHGGEDRESGLRGGGPRLAPGRRRSSLRDITMQSMDGRRALGKGTDNKADGGRVPAQASQERAGIGVLDGGMVACIQAASMRLILGRHGGSTSAGKPARSVPVGSLRPQRVASGAPVEDLQVVKVLGGAPLDCAREPLLV